MGLSVAVDASSQQVQLGDPARVLGLDKPLHSIRDVALTDDHVFVLTAPAPAVHVFRLGANSDYIAFAEEGSGPGELENPVAIALGPELIHVLDLIGGAPRAVTYSMTGDPERTLTLSDVAMAVRIENTDGGVIVETKEFTTTRHELILLGQPRASIIEYSDPKRVQLVSAEGPLRRLRVDSPFAALPRWTATAGGEVAFWPGTGSRLNLLTTTGTSVGSLSLPSEVVPVTSGDHEVWFRRTMPAGKTFLGIQDAYRGVRQVAQQSVTFPANFPAVLGLESDPAGGVWVLRAVRANGEIWSLVRAGDRPRSIIAPPGREVIAFGRDIIVAKATREYDVEIVEVYARPAAVR